MHICHDGISFNGAGINFSENFTLKRIVGYNVYGFTQNTIAVRIIASTGIIVGNIQNGHKSTDDPIW